MKLSEIKLVDELVCHKDSLQNWLDAREVSGCEGTYTATEKFIDFNFKLKKRITFINSQITILNNGGKLHV